MYRNINDLLSWNYLFHLGSFLGAKAFDTYADGSAGNRLRDYLNNLSGKYVTSK